MSVSSLHGESTDSLICRSLGFCWVRVVSSQEQHWNRILSGTSKLKLHIECTF